MLAEDEVEKIQRAGKILRTVREKVPGIVFEGAKAADICETVEGETRKLGGEPAFPCNVGINSVGAHYSSPPGDLTTIPSGSLVKVDLGVHIDGYIADSAITVSVDSEYEVMIKVVEEALENAIKVVAVGGRISDVGSVVERTIRSRGFRPISNLTGHQINRYNLHAGVSIPNVAGADWATGRFQPWSVYALEPFVTLHNAEGQVKDGFPGNILHVIRSKGPKDAESRSFFSEVYKRYRTLPFAKRWVVGLEGYQQWKRLVSERTFYEYPMLVEATGKPIAQAEHTLLLTDKEIIVTT